MTPGLFAAWETSGMESTIEWSVGRFVSEGIEWSEPEALTSDLADDFSIDLFTDAASVPVVLWLQRDYAINDDTDLYYQPVGLSGIAVDDPFFDLDSMARDPGDWPFCSNPGLKALSELPPGIPIIGGHWGWKVIGSGCAPLTTCNPVLTPNWEIEIPLGQLAKFVGNAGFTFKFQLEQCPCSYMLHESAINAGIGINIDVPVAEVPLILGKIPVGYAIATLGVSRQPRRWSHLALELPNPGLQRRRPQPRCRLRCDREIDLLLRWSGGQGHRRRNGLLDPAAARLRHRFLGECVRLDRDRVNRDSAFSRKLPDPMGIQLPTAAQHGNLRECIFPFGNPVHRETSKSSGRSSTSRLS